MQDFLQKDFLFALGWDLAIFVAAYFAAKLAQMTLLRIFHAKQLFYSELMVCVARHIQNPLLGLLIFLALSAVVPLSDLSGLWQGRLLLLLKPLSVAMLGWLIIGISQGTGEWLEKYYQGKQKRDKLGIRRFNTQIRILMRLVITVIIVLTVIGMAMVIPTLRQLGMSLFASAGVAGIVLGIAAKETLSNLIAGAQLALTQQILLGDEVVVQDQFGTIEEITSSYVVVRSWDLRRLVIPLRYFMENAFENWTYHETALLAPIYFYTDYSVNIASLRAEVERIVRQSQY